MECLSEQKTYYFFYIICEILNFFIVKIEFFFYLSSRLDTKQIYVGDLPQSAICKLEHSSYEKLFLRRICEQEIISRSSKILSGVFILKLGIQYFEQ